MNFLVYRLKKHRTWSHCTSSPPWAQCRGSTELLSGLHSSASNVAFTLHSSAPNVAFTLHSWINCWLKKIVRNCQTLPKFLFSTDGWSMVMCSNEWLVFCYKIKNGKSVWMNEWRGHFIVSYSGQQKKAFSQSQKRRKLAAENDFQRLPLDGLLQGMIWWGWH